MLIIEKVMISILSIMLKWRKGLVQNRRNSVLCTSTATYIPYKSHPKWLVDWKVWHVLAIWHTTNLLLRRLDDVILSLYSWQSVFNLSVPVFLRFPRKLYCSHVWSGIDYTFPLLLFPGCFSKLFMDESNNRLAVCRFSDFK